MCHCTQFMPNTLVGSLIAGHGRPGSGAAAARVQATTGGSAGWACRALPGRQATQGSRAGAWCHITSTHPQYRAPPFRMLPWPPAPLLNSNPVPSSPRSASPTRISARVPAPAAAALPAHLTRCAAGRAGSAGMGGPAGVAGIAGQGGMSGSNGLPGSQGPAGGGGASSGDERREGGAGRDRDTKTGTEYEGERQSETVTGAEK
jgi:hypothetical protein